MYKKKIQNMDTKESWNWHWKGEVQRKKLNATVFVIKQHQMKNTIRHL